MVKLFVVGFPRDMSEISLDQLFSKEAMIRRVTIIRDIQTGISKGYAFVETVDQIGAERAIRALHGTRIGDRTMSVRIAEEKTPQSARVQNVIETNQIKSETEKKIIGKRPRKARKF
ncbi:RNA-binding protein [Mucilaginibacter galii]|uniref:RRM domain-containing protein n=1 Tax=Mucilaginibacter galii TaxID=2005073 RepID=A0A917JBJ5_9SPHI|nr:RNA-binding protein [Mucilaginibacter galii]GGI52690.1 hypothetical protein GCM10011425_39020 [Mucilaginibacter galii]